MTLDAVDASKAPPIETTVPLESGRGAVEIPVDSRWSWRIRARAEGFWSPAIKVSPDSRGTTTAVATTLWPAGKIEGQLVPPLGSATPDRLTIRLAPAFFDKEQSAEGEVDGGQPEGTHSVTCQVAEDHRLSGCVGPAGHWNLRLQAGSFSPLYVWGVHLASGKDLHLGEIELLLGGSIAGRAVTARGSIDSEMAAVELRPLTGRGDLDPERRKQLAQLRRKAQVGTWGDFQFTGVVPGTYQIIAQQEGFASSEQSPVVVDRGEETRLEEPLVLEELNRLRVEVSPAADPFGEPWTVRLHRTVEANIMEQAASGTIDSTGVWVSPPIASGPLSLQVLDQAGNSLGWWDVSLEGSDDFILVDLPIVFVDGRVEMGGEPLSSRLWFGGRTGEESIKTETDEDGSFYVVLPREGEWIVDVQADDPMVLSRGLEVEVDPVSGLRTANVTVEVPSTVVEGEVVNEVGVPIQSARVLLQSYGTWRGVLPTDTDLAGRFELRGMRPGQFSIEAKSSEGRSEPVMRQVDEGQTLSVRLTVRKERTMVGRVVSDSGPVPSARILVFAFTRAGRPASMRIPDGRSDLDGRFEVAIPGSAATVRVMVMAPGFALHLGTVREGARLEIPLSRASGTLKIGALEASDGTVGLVMAGDQVVSTARLRTWAVMNGSQTGGSGSFTVPAMPPGTYAYCRLSVEEALVVLGGAGVPKAESCSRGFLVKGGELSLELGS